MNRNLSLILVVTMITACGLEGGERANGTCPNTEVCSNATPNGLYFQGADLSDGLGVDGPWTIAVGGTQRIRVATANDPDSPDFALAFDAKSNGPALGVGALVGSSVTVDGLQAGFAHLRIVEPGSEILYDRIAIDVRPVTIIEIEPKNGFLYDGGFSFDELLGDGQQNDWVIFAGATGAIVTVHLHGDPGRLVDESMAILGGTQIVWDAVAVDAPLLGNLMLSIVLGNGDGYSVDVPVVTTLDEIRVLPAVGGLGSSLVAGETEGLCFGALNAGRAVAGADWTATGSANIGVTGNANCFFVEGLQPGDATLRVTAGGLSTTIAITVVAASGAQSELEEPTPGRVVAGERARSVGFQAEW